MICYCYISSINSLRNQVETLDYRVIILILNSLLGSHHAMGLYTVCAMNIESSVSNVQELGWHVMRWRNTGVTRGHMFPLVL